MTEFLKIEKNQDVQLLFGKYDQNIKLIEKELNATIIRSRNGIKIDGQDTDVKRAVELFKFLAELVDSGRMVRKRDITYALRLTEEDDGIDFQRLAKEKIDLPTRGGVITPKTRGQFHYIEAIKKNDIVFGIGPAGTGKTYLAVAMAVNALNKGLVRRIILTRPAVEAGERLGFLPGDMIEKVSPYLRPMYDALYEMMDPEKVEQHTEQGIIEIAPLAFMRGRTLNEAFVILDEAQNSTPEQMKMFLTRLGFDSKAVITGDVTQSDLPGGEAIGLVHAQDTLKDVDDIKFVHLTGADTVRHELVQKIIQAYERKNK